MFDYEKLGALQKAIKKAQFVPMNPEMAGADPGAGAPPPDAAGAPPPDAAGAPPPDAAGGMPPPPLDAAGMPPADPSMMDPAAMGMPTPEGGGDVSPTGEPYMKITPTQLSKLFKQFAEVFKSVLGIQGQPGQTAVAQAPATDPAVSQKMTELDAKLDALLRG